MLGRHIIFICIGGLFALAMAGGARAQMFTCTGEDGRKRFVSAAEQCTSAYKEVPSSSRKKPAKKPTKKPSAGASNTVVAPGRLPKVSSQQQTTLDKKRGEILLYELLSEEKIHGKLGTLIAAAESDTRRQFLLKRRGEHERNITAIRRELARLGYDAAVLR